jgi:hypothetical protein
MMVQSLQWWCQGHTFTADMRILEMTAYDAILGFDWLKAHSQMHCYWKDRMIEFQHLGTNIRLQVVQL